MNRLLKTALACAVITVSARAQVDQATLSTMKWPPSVPITWVASKIFQYAGDYGYYQDYTPMSSDYGSGADWLKWRFVYYTGLTGKRVVAWGDWGNPSVGPPTRNPDGSIKGDNCGHTHVTYAVWMQYGYYSGGRYYSGYVGPLSGGSKAGIRVNDYSCPHNTTGHEGWGNEAFSFDFPKAGSIWQAMILGAMANSHANKFGCLTFACVNQPWLGAYSVPY